MRVLILAPQTFFCERGTPISEENLIRIMSERGWQVDVLAYSEGSDLDLPGVTIYRIPKIPGIRDVPTGFSIRKLISDVAMTVEGARMIRRNSYDFVHGVEEAVFISAMFRKLYGIPYVYDMDSILSEQITDRFPFLMPFLGGLRYVEEVAVTDSVAVVAVCEALAASAEELSDRPLVARLEDRTQLGPAVDGVDSLRDLVGKNDTIALYVGNLVRYQGIDLLLAGFAAAAERSPDLALVVIGGSEENLAKYRDIAVDLGVEGRVYFLGPRPVDQLRSYLEQADILVSPRITGTNTPMKIYSFLDAGVPVLATRLWTHTQVLDDEIACLFDPDPGSLADAFISLSNDQDHRDRLAKAATQRVAELYSRQAYARRANWFLEQLESRIGVPSA
jgi:glycosyltransferase involved in cell wall biosynthesis